MTTPKCASVFPDLVVVFSTELMVICTVFTSVFLIDDYDVKWYYCIPVWILLVSNQIACLWTGGELGREKGKRDQKREDFFRSIGYFEPGEELKALRAKERELAIDYEHLRYVEEPEKCRIYHEMLMAWKKDGEEAGEAMEKYMIARESFGDTVEEVYKCRKAIEALQPEIKRLEDKEACEAAKKTRKMKDEYAACATEGRVIAR